MLRKFNVFYAVYCSCNFKKTIIIIIEKPKLWLSSMATMHEMTLSFCSVRNEREQKEESLGAFLWDELDQDY